MSDLKWSELLKVLAEAVLLGEIADVPHEAEFKQYGRDKNLGGIEYRNIRVVEQNPYTGSKYALMVKNEDADIAWIFYKGDYYARYQNGRIYYL